MRFYIERVEANRNFANKLWNATRFVLMNLDEDMEKASLEGIDLQIEDKWILTRLHTVIGEIKDNMDKYEIGLAGQRIYDFIWEDYCDWYIEMVKSRLYGDDKESAKAAQNVLVVVLMETLKLLHPFMPFITEEIWQHLPGRSEALIVESWPEADAELIFQKEKENIEFIKTAIKGIRNARAEMNIAPSRKSKLIFVLENDSLKSVIEDSKVKFMTLASAEDIVFEDDKKNLGDDNISVVLDGCEIYLPLSDLIDFDKEIERLQKEKSRLEDEIRRVKSKLSNEGFVSKAPAKIVEEEKDKQMKYSQMLENVLERLESLKR
jgi:valyl-tRNA synthetase